MANKAVIKQWVEALRSGEYQQGRGGLLTIDSEKPGKYCCLGVLCDLAAKAGICKQLGELFDGRSGFLPDSVQHWADLDQDVMLGDADSASGLNDAGYSFKDIASRIEAQFLLPSLESSDAQ